MGQDTRCDIGVSYICEYTPENKEILLKLMKMKALSSVHAYKPDDDEVDDVSNVTSIDESQMFDNDVIATQFEYYYGYRSFELIGRTLTFAIEIYKANAYNISRRETECPYVCGESDTPMNLISKIQNAMAEFMAIGISEEDLVVGYVMHDSH